MVLTFEKKERLKQSWGDKAEAMECNAEVRVYDPNSSWQCFIYAMNPEDENEIMTIEAFGRPYEIHHGVGEMSRLLNMYQSNGEPLEIDFEFRPRNAGEILRKLRETGYYDR